MEHSCWKSGLGIVLARGTRLISSGALAALMLASFGLVFDAAATPPSLYERLGGEARMKVVIGQMIDSVAKNPEINQSFKGVNLKRLKAKIVLQICALTGGGCVYDGDDMKKAHAGLHISEAEMYGLVEALRNALDRNGVGQREKNELLAILAPMKKDVVTR